MRYDEVEAWFAERPKWLQECAVRLVTRGELTEHDIAELLNLCKSEANGETVIHETVKAESLSLAESSAKISLTSISDVNGVNAIEENCSLVFGGKQISIVFGRNGSGKSGYVRLLKQISGARNSPSILPNVFHSEQTAQSATISFEKDGASQQVQWSGGSIDDLHGVDIYDTSCGLIYVNNENEVTYEPWILRLFTEITDAATIVAARLRDEKAAKVSTAPIMPESLQATSAYKWYSALGADTDDATVDDALAWSIEDDENLNALKQRLGETDPVAAAGELRTNAETLLALVSELKGMMRAINEDVANDLANARTRAKAARKAADEDAERVFASAPLDGVGSQSWRLLWESARKYSESRAYPAKQFPHVAIGARCVLCQQELSDEALSRFRSFEDFVKGDLQEQAERAERELGTAVDSLPELPGPTTYEIRLRGAGIKNNQLVEDVRLFSERLSSRIEDMLELPSERPITTLPSHDALLNLVQEARRLSRLARQYDHDAADSDRVALKQQINEAEARKWLNSQQEAVREEIGRLRAIATIDGAIELTSTQAISRRKSTLTDELVTRAYESRFQNELKLLGAEKLHVELVKSRTQVGHVYHKIQLHDSQKPVRSMDVLSEGEFRVVSLAAFLADTTGRMSATPFVFDDPISSLDHVFEEHTAMRLSELAQTRQLIVFTHRLSLVGLIMKYASAAGADSELIALSRNHIGRVTELPIELKRTDRAVNQLYDHRLKAAEKAFGADDSEYDAIAKGICSDIRILVERVVESDLLNGVVSRFSPEVNTKGKLSAIADITEADCSTVDAFMTKYSRYEHSQPSDSPVPIPQPDEIRKDLEKLRDLIGRLRDRQKKS